MARRTRPTRLNWGFAVVASLLFAAVILVTLAGVCDFQYIPSWDELFATTTLTDAPVATEAQTTVHVIDVGQGDSILIKTPQNNLLIDAGERENGTEVVAYLQSQGVQKLDYIIATHPHADHIGGMAYVIANMEVGQILAPRVPDRIVPTSAAYKTMLEAVQAKGLKLKAPAAGEAFDLGDGASFTVVGPTAPDDEMNNNSLVLRLQYKERSFLFTGDCERDMERKILESGAEVSADVLKLGHHGSSTSTSAKWLAAVNPHYAIICCGLDNSYGHPHKEIVKRLNENKIETYRTDLHGTIIFETDGKTIQVTTTKE